MAADGGQRSEGLRVGPRLTIPKAELSVRFSRSSGPGGQGVNTTDSRVELSFDLLASPSVSEFLKRRAVERLGSRLVGGVLTVTASSERSQLQNRQAAERRLAEILAGALAPPPKPRRKTKPTRSSVEKRISAKKRRGETKRLRGKPFD
ncbi:MAG: alternative ribosome rescue aminoacyl-tRNA hydrolase ArfB [Actinomycetes bacterium]